MPDAAPFSLSCCNLLTEDTGGLCRVFRIVPVQTLDVGVPHLGLDRTGQALSALLCSAVPCIAFHPTAVLEGKTRGQSAASD
jgi:hypothetical protein